MGPGIQGRQHELSSLHFRMRYAALVILAIAWSIFPAPMAGAGSVDLRLLSYNIHGLPPLVACDAPKRRMPLIAGGLNDYDVTLIQEDFEYRDRLRDYASETQYFEGNGRTLRWQFVPIALVGLPVLLPCWLLPHCSLPQGSGLTTFVLRADIRAEQVAKQAYGSCNGWVSHATDCLGNKGFLGVRLKLSNGAEIDVYNTHLEADFREADRSVRKEQLLALAREIKAVSAGRAVIVAGDLNSRASDPDDLAPVCGLVRDLGLEFADTRTTQIWPEQLDYILYRSGDNTSLDLRSSGEDSRFVYDGGRLSDHPAVFAHFQVRLGAPDPHRSGACAPLTRRELP